jgi:hypothetical protein
MLWSLAFLLLFQLNPSTDPVDFDLARGSRQLDAVKISEAITIDGVLNELNTSVTYTHNNISLAGGRADSDLVTTRVNYSISTTAFINALVQYNSSRNQWSSNIRFNVIHRPLSDFYVVYNERRNSISGELEDRAVIAKLTYMLSR